MQSPVRERRLALVAGALILGVGLGVSLLAQRACSARFTPALPPLSSSATLLRSTPNVLLAVRDLARLESVSFHMERVIDLSEKQSHVFGLVEAEDAILLVAVADVSAGVDLAKIPVENIRVDAARRRVEIVLPPAEIFHTELDNTKTYVHTRRTGVLARRRENLETRARQEAERALLEAAREAGILARAAENARRVVEGLVRSLGYDHVEVRLSE